MPIDDVGGKSPQVSPGSFQNDVGRTSVCPQHKQVEVDMPKVFYRLSRIYGMNVSSPDLPSSDRVMNSLKTGNADPLLWTEEPCACMKENE